MGPRPVNGENGVVPLYVFTHAVRQSKNVVGKFLGPSVFFGAMYQLCVPLSFSSGGVNKPLENDGAFTYGFNRKVDPCE